MNTPSSTSHRRGGISTLLLFVIILLLAAIVLLLTTDAKDVVLQYIRSGSSSSQIDDSASPTTGDNSAAAPANQSPTPPAPVESTSIDEPTVSDKPIDVDAPMDVATPKVDPEVLRLQKLDNESRGLFALANSYYQAKKFDLAIKQLRKIIDLGHPDWTDRAKRRLAFVQSVQSPQ